LIEVWKGVIVDITNYVVEGIGWCFTRDDMNR